MCVCRGYFILITLLVCLSFSLSFSLFLSLSFFSQYLNVCLSVSVVVQQRLLNKSPRLSVHASHCLSHWNFIKYLFLFLSIKDSSINRTGCPSPTFYSCLLLSQQKLLYKLYRLSVPNILFQEHQLNGYWFMDNFYCNLE